MDAVGAIGIRQEVCQFDAIAAAEDLDARSAAGADENIALMIAVYITGGHEYAAAMLCVESQELTDRLRELQTVGTIEHFDHGTAAWSGADNNIRHVIAID